MCRYLKFLFLILLSGYATLGKGFAYLHLNIFGIPLYIGEIFLFFGIYFVLKNLLSNKFDLLQLLPIFAFLSWSLFITILSFPKYGLECLRDSAMCYYSLFCVIVYILLQKAGNHDKLISLFLFIFPFIIIFHFLALLINISPITAIVSDDIPLVFTKYGDLAVWIVASILFILFFYNRLNSFRVIIYLVCGLILIIMVGLTNRGGFLALLISIGSSLLFLPLQKKIKILFFLVYIFLNIIIVNGLFSTHKNENHFEKIYRRTLSAFFHDSSEGRLKGTVNWRISFWKTLIIKTTFNSNKLLLGHGFGPNLAANYKFGLANVRRPNKHPHNYTINIFARTGIIGLLLWVFLNCFYVIKLFSAYSRSYGIIKKLIIWLFCIWLASIINSSFDAYLVGPMGAIPFWIFMGLGFSLIHLVESEIKIHNHVHKEYYKKKIIKGLSLYKTIQM